MDICGYAPFRHLLDDQIPLLNIDPRDSNQVEVVRAIHSLCMMHQVTDAKLVASRIVPFHDDLTPLQQALISIQLPQPDRCHDVRHVALVPRPYDIIFPCADLGLRQCIFVLAV